MTSGISVLLRGVAWRALAALTTCALVVGGAGVAVARNPDIGPPLLASAFALLGAAAAVTLDEAVGAVVDVTPTGLSYRTAARSSALAAPVAVGLLLVAAISLRNAGLPEGALLVALFGNVLLGLALACIGRRRNNEPGAWAATAMIVTFVLLPGIGPIPNHIHTFPSRSPVTGISCTEWWSLVITASVAMIAAGCHPGRVSALPHRYRRSHIPRNGT